MKIPTLQNVYDENTTEATSDSYPYGRLRCQAKWWVEDNGKKGMRACFQTINPKTGRVNAPKKGTYSLVVILVKNPENNYIESHSLSPHRDSAECQAFLDKYELSEKDEKFITERIERQKKMEEYYEKNPVKFVITTLGPVRVI